MNISLLTAKPLEHGYTWTLTSRLGDMLFHAEKMFGPRDSKFTILGIEFCKTGPRIWYPKSARDIVIQLTPEALNSETIALYQLSHECVHLLSPSGTDNGNVLEEGVAVYFSWWYLRKVLGIDGHEITDEKTYKTAGLMVEAILHQYPDFFKQVRRHYPHIWETTPAQIMKLIPLSTDAARMLTTPFKEMFLKTKQTEAF